VSDGTQARIEVRSLAGELTRVIALDAAPVPISEARKEQLLGMMPAMARDGAEVAANFPFITALREGPAGTIWASGTKIGESETAPATQWYVFGPDGVFRGAMDLPFSFYPVQARGDQFYGIARDSLGVNYVLRVRLDGL
jgi:hypothetical protein